MWLRHWGLSHDPFADGPSTYVPLPSHDEAIARLVFSIERGQRLVALNAGSGMGKTTVIRQAIRATRDPRRRAFVFPAPTQDRELPARIAEALGLPSAAGTDREGVWRAVGRRLGAAAIEGIQVVLMLDQWDTDPGPGALQDLLALAGLSGLKGPPLTIVRSGRAAGGEPGDHGGAWTMALGLERLTRSEAEVYVEARLAAAGCRDRIFTPRALGRLHSWSEGVPGTLGELSTFAMLTGATRKVEVVTPDLVDGIALRGLVGIDPSLSAR